MTEYKMAKGAVKVSPQTEDVRLYVVIYQPNDYSDYYPLGEGLWSVDQRGTETHKDSYWTDKDLAEARVRFIKESGGVGGFSLLDPDAVRVVQITPTTKDLYVLLEKEDK